ncbi:MAG: hypothetical protein GY833_16490 [Aestuariibacter sp.]|nr:hypothetical protein [Aestuariibacter sp.]
MDNIEDVVKNLQATVAVSREGADDILMGGDNYDGADGAREVQHLCNTADKLFAIIADLLRTIDAKD